MNAILRTWKSWSVPNPMHRRDELRSSNDFIRSCDALGLGTKHAYMLYPTCTLMQSKKAKEVWLELDVKDHVADSCLWAEVCHTFVISFQV